MTRRAWNKRHQSPAAWGQEASVDPAHMGCLISRTERALLPAVRPSADRGDRMGGVHATNSTASAAHGMQGTARGYPEALHDVLRGAAWGGTEASRGVLAGVEGESELSETISSASAPSPSQVCKGAASDTIHGSLDFTSTGSDGTRVLVDSSPGHHQAKSAREAEYLIDIFHIRALQGDDRCAEGLLCMSADTYNFIIHSCAQAGDINRVEGYPQRMTKRGVESNLGTFNCMVLACAPSGDRVRAGKLLLQILSQGMRPGSATYASICKVLSHDGLVSEIAGIMILCETVSIPLNEDFFAALIAACGVSSPADRDAERAVGDLCCRGVLPRRVKSALERYGRQKSHGAALLD